MTELTRSRWMVGSIAILFLWTVCGCSTSSVVMDWNELPKARAILVATKSGDQIRLDRWQFVDDKTLIGWSTLRSYRLPKDSIASIATVDDSGQKLAETSSIVIGSAVGVILLVYIVRAITGISFGKT